MITAKSVRNLNYYRKTVGENPSTSSINNNSQRKMSNIRKMRMKSPHLQKIAAISPFYKHSFAASPVVNMRNDIGNLSNARKTFNEKTDIRSKIQSLRKVSEQVPLQSRNKMFGFMSNKVDESEMSSVVMSPGSIAGKIID